MNLSTLAFTTQQEEAAIYPRSEEISGYQSDSLVWPLLVSAATSINVTTNHDLTYQVGIRTCFIAYCLGLSKYVRAAYSY